jgi:O-antigen ligase
MKEKFSFITSGFYYGVVERIPWVFAEFNRAFPEAKIFGTGTGTLSQGLDYVSGGPEWLRYQAKELRQGFLFETGVGKILFELGVIGFFSFYLFFGYLFYKMFIMIKLLNGQDFKDLGWVIIIYLSSIIAWFSFFHNQVLGDATTLIIVWFFIGIFFRFKSLENSKIKLK